MKKKIMVTVTGSQQLETDGQEAVTEKIEVIAGGTYYFRDEVRYISYDEHLEGLDTPIHNFWRIREGRAELSKKGPVQMKAVFVNGMPCSGIYETPYGPIPFELEDVMTELETSPQHVALSISYSMNLGGNRQVCRLRLLAEELEEVKIWQEEETE